eukprot:1161188-Pelagomonas_calceolata.AAC.4
MLTTYAVLEQPTKPLCEITGAMKRRKTHKFACICCCTLACRRREAGAKERRARMHALQDLQVEGECQTNMEGPR